MSDTEYQMSDTENQKVSRQALAAVEARGVLVEESPLQLVIRRYLEAKGLRARAKDQDTDTNPAVKPQPKDYREASWVLVGLVGLSPRCGARGRRQPRPCGAP